MSSQDIFRQWESAKSMIDVGGNLDRSRRGGGSTNNNGKNDKASYSGGLLPAGHPFRSRRGGVRAMRSFPPPPPAPAASSVTGRLAFAERVRKRVTELAAANNTSKSAIRTGASANHLVRFVPPSANPSRGALSEADAIRHLRRNRPLSLIGAPEGRAQAEAGTARRLPGQHRRPRLRGRVRQRSQQQQAQVDRTEESETSFNQLARMSRADDRVASAILQRWLAAKQSYTSHHHNEIMHRLSRNNTGVVQEQAACLRFSVQMNSLREDFKSFVSSRGLPSDNILQRAIAVGLCARDIAANCKRLCSRDDDSRISDMLRILAEVESAEIISRNVDAAQHSEEIINLACSAPSSPAKKKRRKCARKGSDQDDEDYSVEVCQTKTLDAVLSEKLQKAKEQGDFLDLT